MRNIFINKVNLAILLLFFISTNIAASVQPKETLAMVEEIFVPAGFDSNDNTEISITGYLPNPCYNPVYEKVQINGNNIKINIYTTQINDTEICATMIVPFFKTISLGLLNKGSYKISINQELSSDLFIAESSSDAIDDFTYANVEYVEREEFSKTIHLKGYNPSNCYEYVETKIISNKKNTYSLLPKMRKYSDYCPMIITPFDIEVELPGELKTEIILLHVRAMYGKSINSFYFPDDQ